MTFAEFRQFGWWLAGGRGKVKQENRVLDDIWGWPGTRREARDVTHTRGVREGGCADCLSRSDAPTADATARPGTFAASARAVRGLGAVSSRSAAHARAGLQRVMARLASRSHVKRPSAPGANVALGAEVTSVALASQCVGGFSGLVPPPQVGWPCVPEPAASAPAAPGTPWLCGVCTM